MTDQVSICWVFEPFEDSLKDMNQYKTKKNIFRLLGAKKLLGTSASLLVTGALLVVTSSICYFSFAFHCPRQCHWGANRVVAEASFGLAREASETIVTGRRRRPQRCCAFSNIVISSFLSTT